MSIVDNIIRKYEPVDGYDKLDSLIITLKEHGLKIEGALDLKIRLKITDPKILGYYMAKYFGETLGNCGLQPYKGKKRYKKVFYGCKAQDELIKNEKEQNRKRLATTDEVWRKMKHKLPVVVIEGDDKVKYTEKAHIIFTPMGNKR